jgi:hypothetical protein
MSMDLRKRTALRRRLLCVSLLVAVLPPNPAVPAERDPWRELEPGLHLGYFKPDLKPKIYNYPIIVLKIDPALFTFHLLNASEHDGRPRSTRAWCEEFALKAAVNASMFRADAPLKSTGYMQNYLHVNNARFNEAFGAFMVFNPKTAGVPGVRMVDSRIQPEWREILREYHTVIQNYRLISGGAAVEGWQESDISHSTAAVGADTGGRILFILSRAPYSTQDFVRALLGLPLTVQSAMYVEGGPEATLYVNVEKKPDWPGNFETGFMEDDDDWSRWRIPNVIGIRKR